MKCALLLVALAVMLGLSQGLSLGKRENGLLNRFQLRRKGAGGPQRPEGDGTGRKGGKGKGSGSKDDDEPSEDDLKTFSAMLALTSLGAKCEIASLYISNAAEEAGVSYEEAWNNSATAIPTLYEACPGIAEFGKYYEILPEEGREMMCAAMKDYGLVMQCANLYAEKDNLVLLGFSDSDTDEAMKSGVLATAGDLFGICLEVFGKAEEAANSVDEDLKEAEEEAGAPEAPEVQLRSLLKKLEAMLRRR